MIKKKILVDGGLGTIGSYLIPFLREKGYDVLCSDVLIRDFSGYVRGDITDFENMYRIFKEYKPDTVIHMAAEVGRIIGEAHPHRVFDINILGSLNIIRLCLEFNSILVNFSTSEVYGHLLDRGEAVKESDVEVYGNFFAQTNLYAMSKLFVEGMIKHYVDNYGLRAISVRPFMIYAPNEYPSVYRSAIINFVHNALTDKRLTVHKGTVRSWCFVSDFSEALELVIKQPWKGKYEVYNIGSDEYYTMLEVAKIVLVECGLSCDLIDIVEPPDHFLSVVKKCNIEKLKRLGYKPKVSLREGIKQVIDWQRRRLNVQI